MLRVPPVFGGRTSGMPLDSCNKIGPPATSEQSTIYRLVRKSPGHWFVSKSCFDYNIRITHHTILIFSTTQHVRINAWLRDYNPCIRWYQHAADKEYAISSAFVFYFLVCEYRLFACMFELACKYEQAFFLTLQWCVSMGGGEIKELFCFMFEGDNIVPGAANPNLNLAGCATAREANVSESKLIWNLAGHDEIARKIPNQSFLLMPHRELGPPVHWHC